MATRSIQKGSHSAHCSAVRAAGASWVRIHSIRARQGVLQQRHSVRGLVPRHWGECLHMYSSAAQAGHAEQHDSCHPHL